MRTKAIGLTITAIFVSMANGARWARAGLHRQRHADSDEPAQDELGLSLAQNALPGTIRKLANHQKNRNTQEQEKRRCFQQELERSGSGVPDLNIDLVVLHCH